MEDQMLSTQCCSMGKKCTISTTNVAKTNNLWQNRSTIEPDKDAIKDSQHCQHLSEGHLRSTIGIETRKKRTRLFNLLFPDSLKRCFDKMSSEKIAPAQNVIHFVILIEEEVSNLGAP